MDAQQDGTWQILAADQRLSDSIIWEIQRQYFLKAGPAAWQDDIVPHQISCNPAMAGCYCDLIIGYLQDCILAGERTDFSFSREEPIYVIELGAGSGRLTHHLIHQFFEQSTASPVAELDIRFVLTDFVPETIRFWQEHPKLRPWFQSGRLDVAHFDATAPQPLHLLNANVTLTPERLKNPFILLANYFFDTIPQDSFIIEDGELFENRLTVFSDKQALDFSDPAVWSHLTLRYDPIPLSGPCYRDARYNDILDLYEAVLPDTAISFPNIGLDMIRFWQRFGSGRYLLLSSDRGYVLADSLVDRPEPTPNLHGSFSLMVNFHALDQFIQSVGGRSYLPGHYQDNLQVIPFLLGEAPNDGETLAERYVRSVVQRGPNDLFALYQLAEAGHQSLPLAALLSLLRLTLWDATLLQMIWPRLCRLTVEAPPQWHTDVKQSLEQVLTYYLPLKPEDPFEIEIKNMIELLSK